MLLMRRAIMRIATRESSSARQASTVRACPGRGIHRQEGSAALGKRLSGGRGPPPEDARRVLEIDLLQDGVGQAHAVDLPAALDGRRALELLVGRLEVAPRRLEE